MSVRLLLPVAAFGLCNVLAAPASAPTYTDTYDNLPTGLPVASLGNQVGSYNGLKYTNFQVDGPSAVGAGHGGVVPESPPNLAGAVASSNIQGHTIATNYSGSPWRTFDLESFWFGCDELTEEGEADVAIGCTLSVVGYYPGGGQTQQAVGGYFANNPEDAPVVQAVLPSAFKGINFASFGVDASAVTPATTNFFLDNLVHVNHP